MKINPPPQKGHLVLSRDLAIKVAKHRKYHAASSQTGKNSCVFLRGCTLRRSYVVAISRAIDLKCHPGFFQVCLKNMLPHSVACSDLHAGFKLPYMPACLMWKTGIQLQHHLRLDSIRAVTKSGGLS